MQIVSPVAFLVVYWVFRIRLTRRRFIFDNKYSATYLSSRFNMMLLGTSRLQPSASPQRH